MLDAMRVFGRGGGRIAQVVGTIAVPVSEAVLAHRQGEPERRCSPNARPGYGTALLFGPNAELDMPKRHVDLRTEAVCRLRLRRFTMS
jgi:hypothetical protein